MDASRPGTAGPGGALTERLRAIDGVVSVDGDDPVVVDVDAGLPADDLLRLGGGIFDVTNAAGPGEGRPPVEVRHGVVEAKVGYEGGPGPPSVAPDLRWVSHVDGDDAVVNVFLEDGAAAHVVLREGENPFAWAGALLERIDVWRARRCTEPAARGWSKCRGWVLASFDLPGSFVAGAGSGHALVLSVGSFRLGYMSENPRDLMQHSIAALWDAARSLGTDVDSLAQLGALVDAVTEAEAQLAGLRLHLLHEARLSGHDQVISEVRHSVRTTTSQATSTLRLATELGDRFPQIAAALQSGRISVPQAEAIVAGLRKLPVRVTRAELEQCQRSILEHVDELGPAELRILAARLWEIIDPQQAEADEARRLAAEERAAHRGRFLRLAADHHGSVRITGQLPVAEAALLSAQLEALLPSKASYAETGESPTPDMRRADALVLLTQAAANGGTLPARGGDRPTVHITMDYDTLISGVGPVGLFSGHDDEQVSVGAARQLACQAGIIPMVLGTDSLPLDVGRTHRFFTPAVTAVIMERDRGCVFPGCTVGPASCQVHHAVPWWARGPSDASNGVLLCPYHHRIVEPDPSLPAGSQWEVYLDPGTGLPTFLPPTHVDPARRPRQHARFILQRVDLDAVS